MAVFTRRAAVLGLAALLAACEHGEPFRSRPERPEGPRVPGPLARLTYNPADDRAPRWLAGAPGGGVLYTAQRQDRLDRDHCLARQPDGGGPILAYACRTTAPDDTLDVLEDAALGAGGSLAYVRAGTHLVLPPFGPDIEQIVVATVDSPNAGTVARRLPYPTPWASIHEGVSHLTWLDVTRLAYVGEQVRYTRPPGCPTCPVDTVRTGLEVVVLDFAAADTGVLIRVPGSDSATALAAIGSDTLIFVIPAGSAVLRHVLSTGQTDTLIDFGAGPLRGVSYGGGRVAAIVGGRRGEGGELHVVTLSSGLVAVVAPPVAQPLWFARPALSADGARVLAEARPLIITPIVVQGAIVGYDTAVVAVADIWLGQVP